MPQPTVGSVHIDQAMTNMSLAYIQTQSDFIALDVFPTVPVDKQTNKYYKYTKNDWFRDEATVRADTDESAGSGYNVDNAGYTCDVFAIHKDIGSQIRSNADPAIDLEREATLWVTQRMLLRQEIQWTTDYFATSIWGTDLTPANLWSDYTLSDPIGDIRTAIRTIFINTGLKPNKLALGYDTFIKLVDHPDIVDRVKYGGSMGMPAMVNQEVLAKLFGLEQVLVCGAVKATNDEGASAVMAFVQGKHALLLHVAAAPGLLTPSAGYIFAWVGVSRGLGKNVAITRIPMPWRGRETVRVEGEIAFDDVVVATDLGYFFNGAVA